MFLVTAGGLRDDQEQGLSRGRRLGRRAVVRRLATDDRPDNPEHNVDD